MRISVQRDLCCGDQMRILAAPGIVRLDELGYTASDGDDIPVGHEDGAWAGRAFCPERAIAIVDDGRASAARTGATPL